MSPAVLSGGRLCQTLLRRLAQFGQSRRQAVRVASISPDRAARSCKEWAMFVGDCLSQRAMFALDCMQSVDWVQESPVRKAITRQPPRLHHLRLCCFTVSWPGVRGSGLHAEENWGQVGSLPQPTVHFVWGLLVCTRHLASRITFPCKLLT